MNGAAVNLNNDMLSCFYQGKIRHRRFFPKNHHFNNKLYLLGIDLDEYHLIEKTLPRRIFGINRHALISFKEKDYLRGHEGFLKDAVWEKVESLGGENFAGRVHFVGQGRCLGIYFSPINVYYCYDGDNICQYVLAEVSNTPWNKRHYYLLSLDQSKPSSLHKKQHAKTFHVSPFMEMNMDYHWTLKVPSNYLSIHLENRRKQNNYSNNDVHKPNDTNTEKVFDATLTMKRHAMNQQALLALLLRHPSMTASAVLSIYWQALKIWLKRIPFVPYPNSTNGE